MSFKRQNLYQNVNTNGNLRTEMGSIKVQKYRAAITWYFFSTVIGNIETLFRTYRFWYRRYFFETVLFNISVLFLVMDFERKNGKFFTSEHNFHLEDDH